MRSASSALPAAVCSLVAAVLVALGFYWIEGTSAGGLLLFAICTAPLSLASAFLAVPVVSWGRFKTTGSWFLPGMWALGLLPGVLYALALVVLLGPEIFAFNLPITPCWLSASSAAFFVVAWRMRGNF